METIISLAPNLFYGTTIAVTILVLSKSKTDNSVQFIDASGESFFKKVTNNNEMEDGHIDRIVDLFDRKADIEHVAVSIPNDKIAKNDYNLSVSSYVEPEDTREKIDIKKLNKEIKKTTQRIKRLRGKIDEIVKKIEV